MLRGARFSMDTWVCADEACAREPAEAETLLGRFELGWEGEPVGVVLSPVSEGHVRARSSGHR